MVNGNRPPARIENDRSPDGKLKSHLEWPKHKNAGKNFGNAPAELERGTKALQFHVCCKVIDQNFDCGCDRYAILRFDSLV